jgi:hypothetical protein
MNCAAAPPRYLLIAALGASFCGLAMLDEKAQHLERRLRHRGSRRIASFLTIAPLAGVLLLFGVTTAGNTLRGALTLWGNHRAYDTMKVVEGGIEALSQELCPHIHKNAIVADSNPWSFVLLCCGNATVKLPPDLTSEQLQDRFIDEQHPGYFISVGDEPQWLRNSERLREVAGSGDVTLFEVRDAAPASRPWNAPPPLVCAGQGPDCAGRFGR